VKTPHRNGYWRLSAALLATTILGAPAFAADDGVAVTIVAPDTAGHPPPETAPGGTIVLRGGSVGPDVGQPAPEANNGLNAEVSPAARPRPAGWDRNFDTAGFNRRYDTTGYDPANEHTYDATGFDRSFDRSGLNQR
jgi:hypothetical protein